MADDGFHKLEDDKVEHAINRHELLRDRDDSVIPSDIGA